MLGPRLLDLQILARPIGIMDLGSVFFTAAGEHRASWRRLLTLQRIVISLHRLPQKFLGASGFGFVRVARALVPVSCRILSIEGGLRLDQRTLDHFLPSLSRRSSRYRTVY